ncbi:unnamed protein product, partial [Discosporangium mesarthrocarpum]
GEGLGKGPRPGSGKHVVGQGEGASFLLDEGGGSVPSGLGLGGGVENDAKSWVSPTSRTGSFSELDEDDFEGIGAVLVRGTGREATAFGGNKVNGGREGERGGWKVLDFVDSDAESHFSNKSTKLRQEARWDRGEEHSTFTKGGRAAVSAIDPTTATEAYATTGAGTSGRTDSFQGRGRGTHPAPTLPRPMAPPPLTFPAATRSAREQEVLAPGHLQPSRSRSNMRVGSLINSEWPRGLRHSSWSRTAISGSGAGATMSALRHSQHHEGNGGIAGVERDCAGDSPREEGQ